MFLSLSYKEWLKTRWIILAAAVVGIVSVLTIFLNLGAISEFNDANAIWNYVIFKKYLFYGDFIYIPVLIGLALAISQFYPEVNNFRLKLTLHLPFKENQLLFYMLGYGTIILFLLELIFVILLTIVSAHFFPSEILLSEIKTILPWLFAGFVSYFFIAAAMVDPLWRRRTILILFGYAVTSYYLFADGYENYNNSLHWFLLIAVLEFSLIFLSGFRFKRGGR